MNEPSYTGTPTIVYQMSKDAMKDAIREVQREQAEEEFFMPYATTIVCARTAAEILNVHYNTVLEYAKRGTLKSEQRTYKGDNSHVRFNLAVVLKFRRDKELKKIK